MSPNDHLSSLPPELLSNIFLRLQKLNGSDQIVGAISRKLLPYTRANLYHTISLSNHSQLPLLSRTLQSEPSLAALIVVLHLCTPSLPPSLPSLLSLHHLLSLLSHVERVYVEGCYELSDEILRPRSPALGRMKRLTMRNTRWNSFRKEWYQYLTKGTYASLRELEVVESEEYGVEGGYEPDFGVLERRWEWVEGTSSQSDWEALVDLYTVYGDEEEDETMRPISPLKRPDEILLNTLTLEGRLSLSIIPLIHSLPHLTSLTLKNLSTNLSTLQILLHLPKSLLSLSLSLNPQETTRATFSSSALDTALSSFSSLESLTLARHTFTSSLFLLLPPSLSSLTLLSASSLSASSLLTLFHGHLPSLKTLNLHIDTFYSLGPSMTSFSPPQPYYTPEGTWSLHPGWVAPIWEGELDYEGSRNVEREANRYGCKVGGTVRRAWEGERRWKEEWERVWRWTKDRERRRETE